MHVLDPHRADRDPVSDDDTNARSTTSEPAHDDPAHDDTAPERAATNDAAGRPDGDDEVIDLASDERSDQRDDGELNVPPRRGLVRVRGLRLKRVRVWSVAKIAAVFFALGYAALLASAVLVWAIANQIGVIADVEELAVTSLGLETFEIVGASLFQVFASVTGVLTLFAYVVTILFALIYNAAGAVFGGLAFETGPLRRPRRVFSLRHRRFITVS